ncbi:MAG TPA: type II CAAX endopeptidase family protein [Solirubrobacteraceae bacterium]|jgi:membrane protease YdiL (CAAX protease family)
MARIDPCGGAQPPDERPPEHGPAPLAIEPVEGETSHSPTTAWRPWTAPLALIAGVVLAAVGGLVVDLPALALGAEVTSSHTPPGLVILYTVVQDVAFVLAAVYCAKLAGSAVRSWQFGLRPPGVGWRSAAWMVVLLLIVFVVLSVAWTEAVSPTKEKLLEQLGTHEGTLLLILSAALTCVIAPICEELLFRGFIFTALRNWRGTLSAATITGLLFGGVHVGSAPVLDLVPLAILGFGLCLLYRYSGSLYPCIAAHSINNSIAFASLEEWSWQMPLLVLAALLGVGAVALAARRVGLIASTPPLPRLGA